MGRRGGPFNPLSVLPTAWYDPSDWSTLWKDTAGTDPVTAHGDAVARMDDKSGNGWHLTQATAANMPLFQISGAERFLLFDGTDDNLSHATFTAIGLPFDRVTALRQAAWTSADSIWSHGSSTCRLLMRPTTPSLEINDGTGAVVNTPDLVIGANGVVTERHVANASKIAVNNAAYVTGDAGATIPAQGLFLGGTTAAGVGSPNFRFYFGLVKAGALTDAEIAKVRTAAGRKCGVGL